MLRRRLLLLACFLLLAHLVSAQEMRRGRIKYDLPERPQSSRMPVESSVQRIFIPAALKPVYQTPDGKVPQTWLGRSLPQLVDLFPGLRLVQSMGERVTYKNDDEVFFELYNNHVVSIYASVKGDRRFPYEEWYNRVLDRADESAYLRLLDDITYLRYYYTDFVFSIQYDEESDLYDIRYDYLVSQPRFGELSPEQ